ncbi:MAG TPA: alpha/beta fold hydrolase [Kofleriaceae bacterium]|nr:alpha/beta fold hydrolase [Kofleriaceae bacterium]
MTGSRGARRLRNLITLARRPRPRIGPSPADAIFAENKWQLLRYRPRPQGIAFATPLLLVPSLINRHYVLDLAPGRSLVEYLVAQGHDVHVIDWGQPGDEDRYLTFDDLCDGYIGRAVRVAARAAGAEKVHLLGYCMGGTLAAIHAAARPERIASLTALAAPVSFAEGGMLAAWTRTRSFDVGALVDGFGNVPWPLMQWSFHLLRPTLNLWKAVHLVERAWDDEFLDSFVAVETWGNDNVSFPGQAYRRYIEALYRDDALMRGDMTLSGRPARLSDIRCPLLCITFDSDNIVPAASATPLLEAVGSRDVQHMHLGGGHVGAVIASRARENLWPHMSRFWAERDGRTSQLSRAAR